MFEQVFKFLLETSSISALSDNVLSRSRISGISVSAT